MMNGISVGGPLSGLADCNNQDTGIKAAASDEFAALLASLWFAPMMPDAPVSNTTSEVGGDQVNVQSPAPVDIDRSCSSPNPLSTAPVDIDRNCSSPNLLSTAPVDIDRNGSSQAFAVPISTDVPTNSVQVEDPAPKKIAPNLELADIESSVKEPAAEAPDAASSVSKPLSKAKASSIEMISSRLTDQTLLNLDNGPVPFRTQLIRPEPTIAPLPNVTAAAPAPSIIQNVTSIKEQPGFDPPIPAFKLTVPEPVNLVNRVATPLVTAVLTSNQDEPKPVEAEPPIYARDASAVAPVIEGDQQNSGPRLIPRIKPLLASTFEGTTLQSPKRGEQTASATEPEANAQTATVFLRADPSRGRVDDPPSAPENQVARQISRIAETLPAPGFRSVRLRLHPEEMGEVNVQVTRDAQGRVSAHLFAERATTGEALSQSLNHLRQELERAGVVVDKLDIRTESNLSPGGNSEQDPRYPKSEPRNHRLTTISETAENQIPASAERLLSLRA